MNNKDYMDKLDKLEVYTTGFANKFDDIEKKMNDIELQVQNKGMKIIKIAKLGVTIWGLIKGLFGRRK